MAARAQRPEDGPASARVRGEGGRWMVLHGALLRAANGEHHQVSVLVEPAQPAHLEALLMRAYGLTPRERQVTGLVLRGLSTRALADSLDISEATVQQHLKAIFDKTGVHSRRELVGSVFQDHYEPRVRDNEVRTTSARAVRDGPMP